MKDLEKYKQELNKASKHLKLEDVLTHHALPNSEEIHNMICGYANQRLSQDTQLFETAESIDYFKYEKELWKSKQQK
ncbi:MAG: hypothetical protein E7376_04150 [Clostridiales bacterium]|nr:hypothetical protein [Clostridiales bacterium]